MKNLWPGKFEESKIPSAKTLLEEQARLLPKLTGDMVFAEITELDSLRDYKAKSEIDNEFMYKFSLRGRFLENYNFNVFSFSHDITLYPVMFYLDEKLGAELRIIKSVLDRYVASAKNQEELEKFIDTILKSDRIKSVVGSIMRLSR